MAVTTRIPLAGQWAALSALLGIGLCLAVLNGWFWRADLLVYDAALARGAAPDDIVIVAIDDASLGQIGRWPWRRAVHAALLDRLRAAGARGVVLDLILTEPDKSAPGDDALLAAAMRRGPPTVLPLVVDWPQLRAPLAEHPPIPELAAAAAGLAHAHVEIDRDGIVRSVYLVEGMGSANRRHLAVELLAATGSAGVDQLPGERAPNVPVPRGVWARDHRMLIPFLGPAGTFHRVSYADVLRGLVPDAQLRGKYVLVGATAQGLGDAYPTPRSGAGVAMPGIEITANVLSALQSARVIEAAPRGWTLAIALLPLIGALLCVLRLSPRNALLSIAALWLATLVFSLLALHFGHWWWPPAASLAALIPIYPLWSWRRLEATQSYLDEELARLDRESMALPSSVPRDRPLRRWSDVLQGRIDRVRDAAERMRQLRRLLGETLATVPDAILVVDEGGRILLANPPAAALFHARNGQALEGQAVEPYLAPQLAAAQLNFQALVQRAPTSVGIQFANGREYLLRLAAFHDSQGERAGSVIDLADVTDLKSAERERDDTIRFLSHDLRSPSTSLLGLAGLLRDPARSLPPVEAAQRIETLAERTLALADGFIALARAQVIEPGRFAFVDLRDVLQDAVDEVWAAAEARHVRIETRSMPEVCAAHGERQMLGRALANLIGNAVKYAPRDSVVVAGIARRADSWVISVRDEGPGIPLDQQVHLFQRFRRAIHHGEADPGGVGLGLAFVRTVAHKHGGSVAVESDAARGATFSLELPAIAVS